MKYLYLFILLLVFPNTGSAKTEVHLKYSLSGSGSYYPYFTHTPDAPGILPESVSAILEHAEFSGENLLLPAKRTNYYLENQLIDFDLISPQWLNQKQRQDPRFIYSDPIMVIKEFIVGRAIAEPLGSVHGLQVGTVRGYYYHDDEHFERIDFASEKELLQALKMRRVDWIIIGDLPALYWSEQLGISFHFNQLHSEGALHFRLLAKHKPLLPQINSAIKALRADNHFKQIEQRYIEQLPSLSKGSD
ncbi:substrate-binding periplasmic protein [Pseudoalteromonas sp. T1lg65]|uniref:substrate-binding periplasmic protein n=1 Tax=Pseudoalteromonas sp. T1lg65 TaxID=2077101 RepID=UPI003F79EE9B